MTEDLGEHYRNRENSLADWKRADELELATGYTVAVDTTVNVKKYVDAKDISYALPAETHFFLTDAKTHKVMQIDDGVIIGIPNEQIIPVKKPNT